MLCPSDLSFIYQHFNLLIASKVQQNIVLRPLLGSAHSIRKEEREGGIIFLEKQLKKYGDNYILIMEQIFLYGSPMNSLPSLPHYPLVLLRRKSKQSNEGQARKEVLSATWLPVLSTQVKKTTGEI